MKSKKNVVLGVLIKVKIYIYKMTCPLQYFLATILARFICCLKNRPYQITCICLVRLHAAA